MKCSFLAASPRAFNIFEIYRTKTFVIIAIFAALLYCEVLLFYSNPLNYAESHSLNREIYTFSATSLRLHNFKKWYRGCFSRPRSPRHLTNR